MIEVFSNMEALATAVAKLFVVRAEEAIKSRGSFSVALSGGETPRRTYERLTEPPFKDHINWKKVHVFWGDERCVLTSDPRSNYKMAREALLDHVSIPGSQIHPILCSDSPDESARRYEALLRDFFDDSGRFDLIFLGLGENGHTASLFPDDPALEEKTRWAVPVRVANESFSRVTLTVSPLEKAGLILFLVTGTKKASALKEVLVGSKPARQWPAKVLGRNTNARWFVDELAAAQLPEEVYH